MIRLNKNMFSFLRPYIFSLNPEVAHDLAIKSLKFNFIPEKFFKVKDEEMLETNFLKKKIRNPIGLAAGFDKSAEVYESLYKFGFGLIEVGTVTPKKQLGNPKPRMFRLEEDEALINRLGFNNDGMEAVLERLNHSRDLPGILGVNIGPNYNSNSYEKDFLKCLHDVMKKPLANYATINISSPNTENLRDFHDKEKLESLIKSLNKLKQESKSFYEYPIFLKVSPDITESTIEKISEIIIKHSISGVILTNTSNKNRTSLKSYDKEEEGGLSGKPIKDLSTKLIKSFYKKLKGKAYIIGVGGVDSGKSAFEKIAAGANVIQLYTGMIYKGPGIVKEIKKELIEILKSKDLKNINDAIGLDID